MSDSTGRQLDNGIDERAETVTRLLDDLRGGNAAALNALLPLVYDELRRLASRQRSGLADAETLNSTALVHGAYLRLAAQSRPQWSGYPHFLAVASTAMRQILLDHARARRAAKRGGGQPHVSLEEVQSILTPAEDGAGAGAEALVALDESLNRLQQVDPRQSRIVECRIFGGMSIEDTAEALSVSPAIVKRGWAMAQAWLYRDLRQHQGS